MRVSKVLCYIFLVLCLLMVNSFNMISYATDTEDNNEPILTQTEYWIVHEYWENKDSKKTLIHSGTEYRKAINTEVISVTEEDYRTCLEGRVFEVTGVFDDEVREAEGGDIIEDYNKRSWAFYKMNSFKHNDPFTDGLLIRYEINISSDQDTSEIIDSSDESIDIADDNDFDENLDSITDKNESDDKSKKNDTIVTYKPSESESIDNSPQTSDEFYPIEIGLLSIISLITFVFLTKKKKLEK